MLSSMAENEKNWLIIKANEEYPSIIVDNMKTFYDNNLFTDCSLFCEGNLMRVHRIVLSACSEYFRTQFARNPDSSIFVISDIKFADLKDIINYMYSGILLIDAKRHDSTISAVDSLKIIGLEVPSPQFVKDSSFNANEASLQRPSAFPKKRDFYARPSEPCHRQFVSKKTSCPICSQFYTSTESMRDHINNIHWHSEYKHVCSVCSRQFAWKATLTKHMKSKHTLNKETF